MQTAYQISLKIIIISILITGTYIFVFESKIMTNNIQRDQLAYLVNFFYKNENDTFISESGRIDESKDDKFWLNSGGLFFIEGNYAHTIQGDLPKYSPWRILYKISNPVDTDNGHHPQNIFRLITKKALVIFLSISMYLL